MAQLMIDRCKCLWKINYLKLRDILIILIVYKNIPHLLIYLGLLAVPSPSGHHHIIMCSKVVWYSVNNFSSFTARSPSITFLISWVTYFLCSHPWKINPTFLIGLEAGSVSLNSVMDVGLSEMNFFSLIQLEQSISYVEKMLSLWKKKPNSDQRCFSYLKWMATIGECQIHSLFKAASQSSSEEQTQLKNITDCVVVPWIVSLRMSLTTKGE